jgi:hypothetical protein
LCLKNNFWTSLELFLHLKQIQKKGNLPYRAEPEGPTQPPSARRWPSRRTTRSPSGPGHAGVQGGHGRPPPAVLGFHTKAVPRSRPYLRRRIFPRELPPPHPALHRAASFAGTERRRRCWSPDSAHGSTAEASRPCHELPHASTKPPCLMSSPDVRHSAVVARSPNDRPCLSAMGQKSGRCRRSPPAVGTSPQPSRASLPFPHRARAPRPPEHQRFGRTGRRPLPVRPWTEEEEALGSFAD